MHTKLMALSLLALSSIAAPAVAQEKVAEKGVQIETIAVLPWIYEHGTKGAKETAQKFVDTVLTKAELDRVSEARVVKTWREKLNIALGDDRTEMPTAKQLLDLGDALGVDWVMTGRADWHSRSIWVSLGPKTKSDCTVDMMIVDVKRREVALDAKKVRMDSTAKEDTLKALGTVFVSSLFTTVSGGPKTPHEQRAAQMAIAKAISPWLQARQRNKKID